MNKLDKFFTLAWEERRAAIEAAQLAGRVIIEPIKAGTATRLCVICPGHVEFIKGALELGGTFKRKTGVWTFSLHSKRLVVDLARRVFGSAAVEINWIDC